MIRRASFVSSLSLSACGLAAGALGGCSSNAKQPEPAAATDVEAKGAAEAGCQCPVGECQCAHCSGTEGAACTCD